MMTSQPIVQRELRAASRRPSTRRIRCWTALLAIGASLIALAAGFAIPGTGKGINPLFGVQTTCAFGLALMAGVFLTSDCLSEEKREGTLGLLLLTDLKSPDLVLGKFAAAAVNGLYCLLALLPVTAVPLLQGGVTLGEFWRMALALVNAMFFSLAAGLCVSAFVNEYARALGSTLALVVLTVAGLPALAALGSGSGLSAGWFCFTLASPFYAFAGAGDASYATQPAMFWVSLIASQLLGWCFLGLANVALAQLWPNGRAWALRKHFERPARSFRASASPRRRPRARTSFFDPVRCLTGSGTLLNGMAWAIVAGFALMLCCGRLGPSQSILEYAGARPFAFLLKALVAFQTCRFFVETRRNGSLELLLCSPLCNADLIQAQWRALRRIFLWPLVVFLLLGMVTAVYPAPFTALSRLGPPSAGNLTESGFLGTFFLAISMGADILAVGWFGMWLALTIRRPVLSPALTILFVLILPSCLYRLDLVADMLFV
ncbi:MAG: ABC transporter permease subunit, partial [Verrucomicrobia bacterium]|nr:ABC transporter permease subunit [Verrucomicrobiota bacterium]